MIAYYKPSAITKKNINKFSFLANLGIGVNMLKYLNDNSLVYRLLQCASVEFENTYDNLKYAIRFDYNKVPFNSIDAINVFNISSTDLYAENSIYLSSIYGYSKYTGNIYNLLGIVNENEFTKYSYPCDIIFSKSASGFYSLEDEELYLKEGKEVFLNKACNNTKITIRPKDGFGRDKLSYIDDIMYIKIYGYDISSNKIEETIPIEEYIDYESSNSYSFIEKVLSIGNKSTITIEVYPYILGEISVWKNNIVDREYADEYKTILTVDINENLLLFHRRLPNQNGYPDEYDLETCVELNIEDTETIYSYLIDSDEELLYIITSEKKLYCFPVIMPYKFNTELEDIKTKKQAIKVSYKNDEYNKKYIFTIQPIGKTNDVELLDIYINDSIYEQDILLDLYRESIDDNIIEIPYDSLFINGECILRFETSGLEKSTLPIYLFKNKIDPLFIKDLNNIQSYNDTPNQSFIIEKSPNTYTLNTFSSSTFNEYYNPSLELFNITSESRLYKLSNSKGIILDNYIVYPAYNNFYFDQTNNSIITHDTITSIRFDNNQKEINYNNINTAISQQNISGAIITGNK